MDQNASSSRSWVSKIVVLVLVIAAGGLAFLFGKKAEDSELVEEPSETGNVVDATTPTDAAPTDTTAAAATYKDGVYSAIGNYDAPSGAEAIDVTLTVKDGVVTDATVDATATNPASKQWQGIFIAGYKEQVVGKKLADLKLTNVSGSSLTPKGFNDALGEIRTEAQA